jgi:hypothetical protein
MHGGIQAQVRLYQPPSSVARCNHRLMALSTSETTAFLDVATAAEKNKLNVSIKDNKKLAKLRLGETQKSQGLFSQKWLRTQIYEWNQSTSHRKLAIVISSFYRLMLGKA